MQSSESMASSEEVIVKMPQCKQLLTSAASGPLTLAAVCASETSAMNSIALFPDEVAYSALRCMTMLCVTGNALDHRKHEESSHFSSVLSACAIKKKKLMYS